MTVTRIEVAAADPDRWILELCIRNAQATLERLRWWQFRARRRALHLLGRLEDDLRELQLRADIEALERTRKLLEAP